MQIFKRNMPTRKNDQEKRNTVRLKFCIFAALIKVHFPSSFLSGMLLNNTIVKLMRYYVS